MYNRILRIIKESAVRIPQEVRHNHLDMYQGVLLVVEVAFLFSPGKTKAQR